MTTPADQRVLAIQQNEVLAADLKEVLAQTQSVWSQLRNASLFITGGTGFIGCWLLEALRHADQSLGLNLQVHVLTRDPEAFRRKAPHLADYPAFQFVAGDVTQFSLPKTTITHVIHAATDASAQLNEENPLKMFETAVEGTQQALKLAAHFKGSRLLFLSSGAVYGQQPWEMERVAEGWNGGPAVTDPRNAYAEAKRAAEMYCAIYQKQFGVDCVTARIFSLLGPYQVLGIHFAAGNFIRDAMAGKPIVVNGNGLPCRSYLYAADLVVWLLHLLVRGETGKAYNVGSERSVSIKELAERVATVLGTGEYRILGAADAGWNPGRYVPDTRQIREAFGVTETVTLEESILRTARWNGWQGMESGHK